MIRRAGEDGAERETKFINESSGIGKTPLAGSVTTRVRSFSASLEPINTIFVVLQQSM
jgi:hypothetical protein